MTLMLQLDAPMMSFGHVAVDAVRETLPFPTLSMMTGLVANALGYDHTDTHKLQALQARIRLAARTRRLRPGRDRFIDYQTTDLGQAFMRSEEVAWTTSGQIELRKGGSARHATHIRERQYLSGGRASARDTTAPVVVALALTESEHGPTEKGIVDALHSPERPLFIGRKCCIPSRPLYVETVSAPPSQAAADVVSTGLEWLWIDATDGVPDGWLASPNPLLIRDKRDWTNQIHVGERTIVGCKRAP
jgi:CRISPR system Cascade subunit CasD